MDLLSVISPNILEIIANWGKWSDMVVVRLPDIMAGSITFENISIKVDSNSFFIDI